MAPRIAQRSDKVPAGIILLAGAARPLEDLFISQVKFLASALPSAKDIEKEIAELQKQVDNVKRLGTDTFDITTPLPMNLSQAYWMLANQYKPLELSQSALAKHPNAIFKSYPRLNHLFQEGEGKSTPLEYSRPSSIPSYVTDDIAAFINRPKPGN